MKTRTPLGQAAVLFLMSVFTAWAYVPPAGSPLASHEHPRLLFTQSDLSGIRARILTHYPSDFQEFVDEIDAALTAQIPDDYMLFFQARNLSFLCAVDPAQMTGIQFGNARQTYCDAAVTWTLAISDDCKDSRHDFGSWYQKGGCKMVPGIAYDWTYHEVSGTQRQQLADKVVTFYDNSDVDLFPPYDNDILFLGNNYLPYMHGIIFGPLAVWGDDAYVTPTKSQAMLDHMADIFLTRVTAVSDSLYGPDAAGAYPDLWGSGQPEGPGYGSSIFPAYLYPIAAASSALDEDFFSTSPFTRDIPLFLYYKLKPFPVDGEFYYAWHDTGTPYDSSYPTTCDTSDCSPWKPRLYRTWAFSQKVDEPALAGVASWLAGNDEFGVPIDYYKYSEGVHHAGLFNMFLGGERDVPAQTPTAAGLPLFKRIGDWTYFKSSHDLYSSTYLEIDAPIWNYASGHNKDNPTALQMSKYGTLIVKSVSSKNGGSSSGLECPRADSGSAPAFGSLTGPYTDLEMSVDSPSVKNTDQASPDLIVEESPSDVGDITIFDSEPGVWDVFGFDYSRWYADDAAVQQAVQQMVYLRGAENQEFFVEYNHIDSTYENRKLLHTPADIAVVGGSWQALSDHEWTTTTRQLSVTNTYGGSHGRLFLTAAYPTSAQLVKIGGDGYEWIYADGSPVTYSGDSTFIPSCRNLAGAYTLQLRTDDTDLITVYQVGNSNTLSAPAPVINLAAAGMKGVQVDDSVVLFSTNPAQPLDSVGYTVTTVGATHHILIGFERQTLFDVEINGLPQSVPSTVGGVLYITDPDPGSRTISVNGGQPCSSHDDAICHDDDLYWQDSCGNREEKKEECGAGGCFDGACLVGGCDPVDASGQNVDYPETFEACGVLTAGDFRVEGPNGDVTFRAGEMVVLQHGFQVELGATFRAIIDPQ
jgi:hypothetical protein